MNADDILATAANLVGGSRHETHGDKHQCFGLIARFWSDYLECEVKPEDVACMMGLVKIARIATGKHNPDNWIDLAGYAACGGEIAERANDPR